MARGLGGGARDSWRLRCHPLICGLGNFTPRRARQRWYGWPFFEDESPVILVQTPADPPYWGAGTRLGSQLVRLGVFCTTVDIHTSPLCFDRVPSIMPALRSAFSYAKRKLNSAGSSHGVSHLASASSE